MRARAETLLLECTEWHRPPTHARLTLSLPAEDEPVELEAVLAAREGNLCDFRYSSVQPATINRLATFIINDRRASLRRRRAWYQTELVGVDEDLAF